MVAGILECLGVPMVADNFFGMSWEDSDIVRRLKVSDEAFKEVVDRRNRKNDIWGFKHPGAHRFLKRMKKILRNPVYLAIWKDPVTVTQRRFGYDSERPFILDMQNTCVKMANAMWNIYTAEEEVHMLSYAQALIKPRWFVEEIVRVTELDATGAEIANAVKFIRPNTTKNWRNPYPQVRRR